MNINNSLFKTTIAVGLITALLTACGLGGPYPGTPELLPASSLPMYRGPVASPQVTYRIDENRFFEYVPRGPGACTNAMVYYNDKKLGIHSAVVELDRAVAGAGNFVIDAANDQYLVGPMTRGNTDCSSGGGGCGGAILPYSVDGGRTWSRAQALSPSAPIGVIGSFAFTVRATGTLMTLDLSRDGASMKDWQRLPGVLPMPVKKPVDTKFHCTANGKE